MGTHSVAEAKNNLSKLIDLALAGEGVVITRHGHAVVELRAVVAGATAMSDADLEWLRKSCFGETMPAENAAETVSLLRDEGEK